ncbi:MAG: prephenate dehydrogenase/arogenate dehydrogenase family protein [Eggerthellaceae bacterium]|jgi:prephenate dehydrogenase|nr:prephenate dehydrogenase/arogenate dehydrogenase family protein [Eggerthellaceae bacterium]MCH4220758.1 prephenate dehydrogenase/arogenate dehydrogenase family protein [Eggerthellaceae bacterium]
MRIAVVGLGLIGASFAASYRAVYPQGYLIGADSSADTRKIALDRGWVNQTFTPDDPAFATECLNCDVVLLALPAAAARPYFEMLNEIGYQGIITDTASTKHRICEDAQETLGDTSLFIPGHPMAGSEVNGIEGARLDLFKGAHWILCPDEHTQPDKYAKLHALLTGIGARVVSLPRDQHDAAVAVVSHVPHIIAASLVELASDHARGHRSLFRLAAGGFKDSTRIAAGSPELWCGITFDNAQAVRDGLEEIEGIIDRYKQAIEQDDRATLTDLLSASARTRRSLPTSWIPSSDNLLEVRIPMENRQGVVAEVTTIASRVGCNIQSIEIDHITADSAVLSLILTDEGDVGQLSSNLINAGFTVSFSPLSAKE